MTRIAAVHIGVLLAILAIPSATLAEEFKAGKVRPYGTLDIFLPANAGDGLWEDVQGGMSQLSGAGYSSVGSIKTTTALGGRIGFMVQTTEFLDIGLSGGYIAGPNSDSSITLSGAGNSAVLADKRKISCLRFLVEPTLKFKMSERSSFYLGSGLGFAHGRTEETISCTGTACVTSGTIAKNSSTWTGFSWEISPYFSTNGILYGVRYAGFPKFNGNAANSKIKWSSFGFFTGVKF